MKKTSSVLDQILDKALEKALAALEDRLAALILEAAEPGLKERAKVILGELKAPTAEAPARARAKAKAADPIELTAEASVAAPVAAPEAPKPRARRAKAAAAPAAEDLEAILEGATVALAKYKGAFTPKGKPLEEVLARRLRKTLQYAQALGRGDFKALAKAALTTIDSNPRGYAMASWTKLATDLGLPVGANQEAGE